MSLQRSRVDCGASLELLHSSSALLGYSPVVVVVRNAGGDAALGNVGGPPQGDGAIRKAPVQRRIGARHKAKRDEDEQSRC
jgi:hypothetical protein